MSQKTPIFFSKKYLRADLQNDAIAALVVTAIAVPESLGFAAIVGLPLVTGLYTALLAPIVFALFASTRRLVVGADSATATLIAAGAGLIVTDRLDHAETVAALTIVTAFILLLLSVLRFGFLADLISKPVLIGFFAGVGLQLMFHKLPEMLGLHVESGTTANMLGSTIAQLPQVNLPTLLVAGIVIICAFLLPAKWPRLLIGLFTASIVTVGFHLDTFGVSLVGALPSGLPSITIPIVSVDTWLLLVPTALSIALVILAQSSAVIRSQAAEHDEPVDINKDLKALGFANIISGVTHGFAINGSPPRTLAAESSGGRTQMVNIIMAIIIGALLLFGSDLFAYVPHAALAAVVFAIGVHLIKLDEMRRIWSIHRVEFFIMMIALISVAVFGVRQGLLIAIIISLMERLRRQYHPSDQILLRDGKLSDWGKQRAGLKDPAVNKPGLLVYAFDGSLFFENVEYFIARVMQAVQEAKEPVDTVIIDTGAIDAIDYTAFDGLRRLHHQLKADDIHLGFAHVSPSLRGEFSKYGIDQLIDPNYIYPTFSEVLHRKKRLHQTIVDRVKRLPLPAKEYVVIGGAVMEILGIRTTGDIDMVVSDRLYNRYRNHYLWKEFVHDDGKRVLSHNGYHLMRTWMGRDLNRLKKDQFMHKGIPCMSIAQLVACKQRLGRKKDIADIKLIKKYLERSQESYTV